MKIAYFDCFAGISGDMFIGAMLDAGLDFSGLEKELSKLNLSGWRISSKKITKNHLSATKFNLDETTAQTFRHLADLNRIIDHSGLNAALKETANKIFLKIAEAEAKVHGQPLQKVHFHEIGALDTIIDVVGALISLELLGVEKVVCSRLNVGSGVVTFSHGTYPVPAPATAEILKGVPIYATETKGELVTPTGAAIISTVAESFGDMPEMKVGQLGYGAGDKDFGHPNVLRVFLGESAEKLYVEKDVVAVIETNIDDMNPQLFDHVQEKLFAEGALDVFFTQILMKKNRPAIKLTVLCNREDQQKMCDLLFRETTTLGVRIREEQREKLHREIVEMETTLGSVRVKVTRQKDEDVRCTPEYDDCKRIAREKNLPLKQVFEILTFELQKKRP